MRFNNSFGDVDSPDDMIKETKQFRNPEIFTEQIYQNQNREARRLKRSGIRSIESINPQQGLVNHILVCQEHACVSLLVRALRKRHLEYSIPIVILSTKPLNKDDASELENYDDVYFVLGDPVSEKDLKKCFVKNADKAVIYRNLEEGEVGEGGLAKDHKVR